MNDSDFSGRSQYGRCVGKGAHKRLQERMDLGLALLSMVCQPNQPLTARDIAAWCGCSRARIQQIESEALKKIWRALKYYRGGEELREMFEELNRPARVSALRKAIDGGHDV